MHNGQQQEWHHHPVEDQAQQDAVNTAISLIYWSTAN